MSKLKLIKNLINYFSGAKGFARSIVTLYKEYVLKVSDNFVYSVEGEILTY